MGGVSINVNKSDVLVIGSGLGGLYCALNLSSKYNVTILTKTSRDKNNSCLAQGGVAASFHKAAHYKDTISAGVNYNKEEAVKVLVEDSLENINKLIDYGTNFEKDELGNFKLTREGGHSKNNILYFKDSTGKEIISSLIKEVDIRKNITIIEGVFAIDILNNDNGIVGILAINQRGEREVYLTKAIVLATGGIGQVYENTTNSSYATGDGIAMAFRAGAEIKDMEFVQFHPTAFYKDTIGQKFLISEAVRGEGGILKNANGDNFMKNYSTMGDLAPRDIVSQSIFKEMLRTNSSFVYLDISHKSSRFVEDRFPMIYETCLQEGYDITKDMIPVAPAEHYLMGGIKTDTEGRTNIYGLYACGECACTGVHGANRLASNSLLECIVYGNRVSKSIDKYIGERNFIDSNKLNDYKLLLEFKECRAWDAEEIQTEIKRVMSMNVSVVRSYMGLEDAYKRLLDLEGKINKQKEYTSSIKHIETINMFTVAILITKAALDRKRSLGAHYLVG